MLWVLKRTVSMRRFFWAPKTNVKTDGLENIYIFRWKFLYLNLWNEYDQDMPQSQTIDIIDHRPTHDNARTRHREKKAQYSKKTMKIKQPTLSSPSRWLQN